MQVEVDFIVNDLEVGSEAEATATVTERRLEALRELAKEHPTVRPSCAPTDARRRAHRAREHLRLRCSDVLLSGRRTYALHEAQRDLAAPDQQERLEQLVRGVRLVEAATVPDPLRAGIDLPDTDWPIVAGAIAARATHLITGDARHFGHYFGRRIGGFLVLPPSLYVEHARRSQRQG